MLMEWPYLSSITHVQAFTPYLPYAGLEIPSLNLTSTPGLFEEINSQRKKKEIIVKEGAIVDATIVESSRRPRKVIDIMPGLPL
jgi:hypothetical protein